MRSVLNTSTPILGLLLVAATALFGCSGGGCAGALKPLPKGGLPASQTIEGGAQVRLTPAGLSKVIALANAAAADAIEEGFPVPQGRQSFVVGSLDYCDRSASGGEPHCWVDLGVDSTEFTVRGPEVIRLAARFDASTRAHMTLREKLFGNTIGSCNLDVRVDNAMATVDVRLSIAGNTGSVTVAVDDVAISDLTDVQFSGCGVLGGALNGILDFLNEFFRDEVEEFVSDQVRPSIVNVVDAMVPRQAGIEGIVDITPVLDELWFESSSETAPQLEFRATAGSWVAFEKNGLSLGLISGLNADRNPKTRGPGQASEPARCVPAFPALDLASAPHSLTANVRDQFVLPPASEFRGTADPAGADIVVGTSESLLNLAAHHITASGALCLRVSRRQAPDLTLGTVGLLLPSLSELGSPDGSDPLQLIFRPTSPPRMVIGDGTEESPTIRADFTGMEIDLYAFLHDRFVRALTVSFDFTIGINLEFRVDDSGNAIIFPVLVGLTPDRVQSVVVNDEFLREDRLLLEASLPTVLSFALPQIVATTSDIAIPSFAGYRLENLRTNRITSDHDAFLAVSAALSPAPELRQRLARTPRVRQATEEMTARRARPVFGVEAELESVTTPTPERIRSAIAGRDEGELPTIHVRLPARDGAGRAIEWSWNIDGGAWRPFQRTTNLYIQDPALALQGHRTIELIARVVDDYETLMRDPIQLPVTLDSVGPTLLITETTLEGELLRIPVSDLVWDAEHIEVAFGSPGDGSPATEFGEGTIPLSDATRLSSGGLIQVWARDPSGNVTTGQVDLGRVSPGAAGARPAAKGCAAGGDAPVESALLLLAAFLFFWRRAGNRRLASSLGALAALALVVACSSGSGEEEMCATNDDCAASCGPNQVPMCTPGGCLCAADVPLGRIGEHSDMVATSDGSVYVSAYNAEYGDLVVASWNGSGRLPDELWQFIDGVPEGPVIVPGSQRRGGISAPGPDVGLYTDIFLGAGDQPMIAYYDQTHRQLKLARREGDAWTSHAVDADGVENGARVGLYPAAVTDREGRPGIAYLVERADGNKIHSELRFARAGTHTPASKEDWTVETVTESSSIARRVETVGVQRSVGLFVSAVRGPDGRVALAYYDRPAGALRVAFRAQNHASWTVSLWGGRDDDAGWQPSIAAELVGDRTVVHVAYQSVTRQSLRYVSSVEETPVTIDDGYREVGTTADGLTKPDFHYVGADSRLLMTPSGPVVLYQDASAHELRLAQRASDGSWTHSALAGHEEPFAGAYGFYNAGAVTDSELVASTWVVDLPGQRTWIEIIRLPLAK